jgi:thymidylate kinase
MLNAVTQDSIEAAPLGEASAAPQLEAVEAPAAAEHEAVDVARIVDCGLRRRALVLGSLPPEGDDLDLVVRRPERVDAASTLAAHGFLKRGQRMSPRRRWIEQWARFRGASAFSVDLNPAERWSLPTVEVEALFDEGSPIEGMSHIVRPAPHHVLLLAARRLARHGGRVDSKRRRRIAGALAEDPDAWRIAHACAPMWGLERAMDLLEPAYSTDEPVPASPRARAFAELVSSGFGRWWAEVVARRVRSKIPRRTRVISISGLDGAGKSSQARALQETFDGLGVDVACEWMPLGHAPRHRAIRTLRKSVESILHLVGRLRGKSGTRGPQAAGEDGAFAPARRAVSPAKSLREQSELVTHAWAMVVAVHQGLQHRVAVLRHIGKGKVVIFDRYTLDASSQLRYFYGSNHEFRFQKRLVRLISPKPERSFLLVVPPEVVIARKDDMQYTVQELDEQCRLLWEEASRLSIPRLSGTRPKHELSEEIAREVWSAAG